MVILFVRLFYLQVIQGDEFRHLSKTNRIRLQNIEPPRGIIFDRKGAVLVDNRPSFNLYIILKDAKPVNKTLVKLSHYTGISIASLREDASTVFL